MDITKGRPPISNDVSHAVGKNCTSDRSVRMKKRSATVSVARTTGGKRTFFFFRPCWGKMMTLAAEERKEKGEGRSILSPVLHFSEITLRMDEVTDKARHLKQNLMS